MDKFLNYPVAGKLESFLAMPNDVYSIQLNNPNILKSIEVKISVPSYSLISIEKNTNSFSILPVNMFSDLNNVSEIVDNQSSKNG